MLSAFTKSEGEAVAERDTSRNEIELVEKISTLERAEAPDKLDKYDKINKYDKNDKEFELLLLNGFKDHCGGTDWQQTFNILNNFKHKRQLELAKLILGSYIRNHSDPEELLELLRLFGSIEKESVMLALANQICFRLKECKIERREDKQVLEFLKKLVLINYSLISSANRMAFRDTWNAALLIEKLTLADYVIPELSAVLNINDDYAIYKSGSNDCFSFYSFLLPIGLKQQLLKLESQTKMRQELQVLPNPTYTRTHSSGQCLPVEWKAPS